MNMVNTTDNSTEDMINKLQELEGFTKLKFYKNISNFYDGMNYKNLQTQEDLFSKNARVNNKIYHEVLLLMKNLHTKPQVKNLNNNYYDLFYTVIQNRREKDNEEEQYEKDYINFNDFITPKHFFGNKNDKVILR